MLCLVEFAYLILKNTQGPPSYITNDVPPHARGTHFKASYSLTYTKFKLLPTFSEMPGWHKLILHGQGVTDWITVLFIWGNSTFWLWFIKMFLPNFSTNSWIQQMLKFHVTHSFQTYLAFYCNLGCDKKSLLTVEVPLYNMWVCIKESSQVGVQKQIWRCLMLTLPQQASKEETSPSCLKMSVPLFRS